MALELTAENFAAQVTNSDKPVVIDFYAEWCGPCQQMAPHFDKLSSELKDSYNLVKLNIDNERDIAVDHNIASIPTLIFYKGGQQVGTENGYLDEGELRSAIEKHLG
ncbi:MAG: thioredoxin [Candidatus Dependentiae bacterium]|jgi:thioredoxin 1